jgi:hypothetical protein
MNLFARTANGEMPSARKSPNNRVVSHHLSQAPIEDAEIDQNQSEDDPDLESEEKSEFLDKVSERGFLDKAFKEPRPGSILYKLKKGELQGKQGTKGYETLLGDILLTVQNRELNAQLYLVSRLAVGHVAALKVAEAFREAKETGLPEIEIMKHLFQDKLSDMADLLKYLKSLAPYHKQIILKNIGLFSKIGMGL